MGRGKEVSRLSGSASPRLGTQTCPFGRGFAEGVEMAALPRSLPASFPNLAPSASISMAIHFSAQLAGEFRVGKGGRCNWKSQPLPVFTTPSVPSLLDALGVAADPPEGGEKGNGGDQRLLSKINAFFPPRI